MKTSNKTSGGCLGRLLSFIGKAFLLFLALCYVLARCTPSKESEPDIEPTVTTIVSEGGTYLGDVIETIYSGNGEFQYLDGGTYTGSFENSQRSGNGTFSWDNGDVYTGTWSEDKMGKGTYLFADGRSYNGSFENNEFYSGIFSLGEEASTYGYEKFSAEFAMGLVHGVTYTAANGTNYEGDISGMAKITYTTGNTYQGSVDNGVREGSGTFKWIEDGKIAAYYEGTWASGIMSGEGTYHYSSNKYPYITGTFVGGKPDGIATYYESSSKIFETTWSNGICTNVVAK